MEKQVTCSMCQGIKMVKVGFLGFRPCPECAGRGYVMVQAHEETIIPSLDCYAGLASRLS